jgi:hypothetical protein
MHTSASRINTGDFASAEKAVNSPEKVMSLAQQERSSIFEGREQKKKICVRTKKSSFESVEAEVMIGKLRLRGRLPAENFISSCAERRR